MKIQQVKLSEVVEIAPLFDAYRQFYEQPSDVLLAESYLKKRVENDNCIIFAARADTGNLIGFTLLYPTFCSLAAQPAWILYDLFVDAQMRRKGVAQKLLMTAQAFALESGAVWLRLETAATNTLGQKLYEKLGWERDADFYSYFFHLSISDKNKKLGPV